MRTMGKGIELFYNYLEKVSLLSLPKNADLRKPLETWLKP